MGDHDYMSLIQFVEKSPRPTVLTTYDSRNPQIVAANRLHEKLTGFMTEEILLKEPRQVFQPLTHNGEKIALALDEEYSWEGFVFNVDRSGDIQKLKLFIAGVVIGDKKYYMCFKQAMSVPFWKRWF